MEETALVGAVFCLNQNLQDVRIFRMGLTFDISSCCNLKDKTINLPGHYIKTIPFADCLARVNACNSMEIDIMSFVFLEKYIHMLILQ